LFPYVSGEGTRLFDDVPKSYQLDLVSSNASTNGIVELQYRPAAPLTQRPLGSSPGSFPILALAPTLGGHL
jgi:hypothetical protein